MPDYRRGSERPCERCRRQFRPLVKLLNIGRGRFCSRQCSNEFNKHLGCNNAAWKGGVNEANSHARTKARRSRYRRRYPEKAAACLAVCKAIIAGKLIRPGICSECQQPCKPQGHHADYSRQLEVRWLCGACHRRLHGIVSRCKSVA
jgi:hypothetical protein